MSRDGRNRAADGEQCAQLRLAGERRATAVNRHGEEEKVARRGQRRGRRAPADSSSLTGFDKKEDRAGDGRRDLDSVVGDRKKGAPHLYTVRDLEW